MVRMAMMMLMGKLLYAFYYVTHDKRNSMTYYRLLLKRYLGVHCLRSIVLSNHTRASAAL